MFKNRKKNKIESCNGKSKHFILFNIIFNGFIDLRHRIQQTHTQITNRHYFYRELQFFFVRTVFSVQNLILTRKKMRRETPCFWIANVDSCSCVYYITSLYKKVIGNRPLFPYINHCKIHWNLQYFFIFFFNRISNSSSICEMRIQSRVLIRRCSCANSWSVWLHLTGCLAIIFKMCRVLTFIHMPNKKYYNVNVK